MSDHQRARIIALNLLGDGPPDEAAVRRTAEIAVEAVRAQKPDAELDTDTLVRELEANLNVVVGFASTLTDDSSDHLPWLADRRASIEWGFTRRYQRFLKERKGWALPTLQRSDDLTDRIIGLLESPDRAGSWDRRGMVVGEVQSGKTSNYIELICKAADAGYKFIVGTHRDHQQPPRPDPTALRRGFPGLGYAVEPGTEYQQQEGRSGDAGW